MASKYDRFWQERLAELRKELGQAAMGKVAGLDVAVIKKLGRRASWHGSTRVRDGEFLAGNMAHAVSLGRQLLQSGMLTAWPRTEFLLSISDGGRLTVEARALAARTATSVPGAEERDAERSPLQDPDAGIINPSEACRRNPRGARKRFPSTAGPPRCHSPTASTSSMSRVKRTSTALPGGSFA